MPLRIPSRSDIKAMLQDWRVAVVAFICATSFLVFVTDRLVYLASLGKGVEVVGSALVALVGVLLGKVNSLSKRIDKGDQQ